MPSSLGSQRKKIYRLGQLDVTWHGHPALPRHFHLGHDLTCQSFDGNLLLRCRGRTRFGNEVDGLTVSYDGIRKGEGNISTEWFSTAIAPLGPHEETEFQVAWLVIPVFRQRAFVFMLDLAMNHAVGVRITDDFVRCRPLNFARHRLGKPLAKSGAQAVALKDGDVNRLDVRTKQSRCTHMVGASSR